MTIYVDRDPTDSESGNWVVKDGNDSAGSIIARRRTRIRAMDVARREARDRNTDYKAHDTVSYGRP